MAFQIPCDVFIWLWYYKQSPSSPPQPPTHHDDLLTPANCGLPCVLMFLYLIDWEFVCVRFVSCQLLRVCMCVCALVHHSVMTSGAAQVQHLNTIRVTKQYMLSSGDHEALQADERQSSELLFYKMLRHLDDRHDTQLCRHMWQSSLPIPSPNWKH